MSLSEMDGDRVSGMLGAIKFDGKNFGIWKMKVRAYFEMTGLWCVLEKRTIPESMDNGSRAISKDEKEMKEKSMKAYTYLILSLPNEQMQLVMHVGNGDAYGVWSALVNHFERKSLANKAHVRELLLSSRMMENESIDLFKARVMTLVQKLKEMGEEVSESEILFVILRGLPNSYESLVQTIRVATVSSVDQATNHIKDYQEMLSIRKDDAHVALMDSTNKREDNNKNSGSNTKSNKKGRKRSEHEKKFVCEVCNVKGH